MPSKTALRKAIDAFCDEGWPDEEILLFGYAEGDPYDAGFLGIGFQQYKGPVAVYDRDRCIAALAEEFTETESPDPYADAVEWFEFNTAGSWIGEQTPIIIAPFPRTECHKCHP